MTYSQNNTIHFGIDALELYGSMKETPPFHLLENEKILPITEYLAIQLITDIPWYEYKVLFLDDFVQSRPPIFAFYKWLPNKNSPIQTKDYICFYSLAFRMRWESEIQKFIEKFFDIEAKKPVRRMDICIDIQESTENFLKNIKTLKQKHAIFHGEKWETETFYIGEKQKTKNKRHIVRIYDKIKDLLSSWKKEKVKYYQKYLEHKNITRVELELRRELTRNIKFSQIFDKNFQKWVFSNYLSHYTNFFENFSEEKISLFQKSEKVDLYDIIDHLRKNRHIQSFLGYAKTMAIGMNICPVKLLIGSQLFSQDTYKELQEKWIDIFISDIQRSKYWNEYIIKNFSNNTEKDGK